MKQAPKSQTETLTVSEVADVLGIGRATAYRAVHEGKLPALRLGRRLVVPRAALERLLGGDLAQRDQVPGDDAP